MRLRYGVCCIAAGCLSGWYGCALAFQPAHRSIPFVAHIEKRLKKSDQDPAPTSLRIVYLRSGDGSFAQIVDTKSPDGAQSGSVREIFDATQSRYTMLEPFTKSAVVFRYSPAEYQQIVGALDTEHCVAQGSTDALSSRKKAITRFGRTTIYQVERIPLPGATGAPREWTQERYVAPELRCFSFHTIDRLSSGAVTEEEVVSLQEGEPSAAYFEIPPAYVERSPQQLNDAYSLKFGAGRGFWDEAAVKNLERRYQRLRAK